MLKFCDFVGNTHPQPVGRPVECATLVGSLKAVRARSISTSVSLSYRCLTNLENRTLRTHNTQSQPRRSAVHVGHSRALCASSSSILLQKSSSLHVPSPLYHQLLSHSTHSTCCSAATSLASAASSAASAFAYNKLASTRAAVSYTHLTLPTRDDV